MSEKWVLVDPIAGRQDTSGPLALGSDRAFRTVGFFSNNKQNCTEIQRAVADWMTGALGITPRFYRKSNASIPAEPALVNQIVAECDAVITGSADCGSCTSSAVHDSDTLRRRGLAVSMLTSNQFVGLATMQAEALGADELPLVVVKHPIGGITPQELAKRSQEAIDRVKLWWDRIQSDPLVAR